MIPDRIEKEISIAATVERVWEVVTRAEHFARWYAFGGAEIELRAGGAMVMRWEEHGTFHGRVEKVDPPRAFSYRYAIVPDQPPRPGNSTLVEITLEAEGAGTRLRVVESGFRSLEASEVEKAEHIASARAGWAGGLEGIAACLVPEAR
jgi:uncharacterized protein YndB with AHSA1/START domain